MSRGYFLLFTLFLSTCGLSAQVVKIDSVLQKAHRITVVYSISDSLEGYRYAVEILAIVGRDTLYMQESEGYPRDSLFAGTHRLTWDPVAALGRYRGKINFVVKAKPGFRVTTTLQESYKQGQEAKFQWYGGGAIHEQYELILLQNGYPVDSMALSPGILKTSYRFKEDLKPEAGYTFRLLDSQSRVVHETAPFSIQRTKERKWYLYAVPAAVVTGVALWLLIGPPIDRPEDFR